jgi:hypothetical protein
MMLDELKARGQMPLMLPGWEWFSVWGWDPAEGALFAKLWRNNDVSRSKPRVWIAPDQWWPATTSVDQLVHYIVTATSHPEWLIRKAMARCAPPSVKEALLGTAV